MNRNGILKVIILLSILMLWIGSSLIAADGPQTPAANPATPPTQLTIPGDTSISGRGKALSFDDELVEGMNKNPFDSLTSAEKKDMIDTVRLYRVKGKFSLEMRLTAEEMGFVQ